MFGKFFTELTDELDWAEREVRRDNFFNELRTAYGLNNVAYLGINLPSPNYQDYYFHATYNQDWISHYQTQNYVAIDPIVRRGLLGLMPIDWSDATGLTVEQKKLFHEAADFRVGNRGLTFPVRGLSGESAIFSVTAEMSQHDWDRFKLRFLRHLRIAGDVFHQSVLGKVGGNTTTTEVTLSPRERECLRWCAEGKTRDDVASILGVSPRVVKFHLEGARHKLKCLNTAHTIATAILRGLI